MPATPNRTPVFQMTRPARAWPIRPKIEVIATTKRLAVMASLGSKPAT
jgi:hypothetical protein